MTLPRAQPLRDVLAMHRDEWDCDDTRPAVREAFAKVVDCGTEARAKLRVNREHQAFPSHLIQFS